MTGAKQTLNRSTERQTIESTTPFDSRDYRHALGRFATGVTVVTTYHEERMHGMTANAFVSVSLDPPLVLVSVDHRAHLHRILQHTSRYGISVLAEDQEVISGHFAGRPVEGFEVRFITRRGIPLIDGAVAYFIVQVVDAHPAGDHTLYIARVEHYEWQDKRPLLFHAGRYDRLREGEAKP